MGYNKGSTFSIVNGHSESDTADTRVSDSLTDTRMNTRSSDTNWQYSLADTVGNSKSHTEGASQGYTSNNNYDVQFSKAQSLAISSDITNSKTSEKSITTSISQVLEVPAGTYGVGALLLLTESTQVQFMCLEGF